MSGLQAEESSHPFVVSAAHLLEYGRRRLDVCMVGMMRTFCYAHLCPDLCCQDQPLLGLLSAALSGGAATLVQNGLQHGKVLWLCGLYTFSKSVP